MFERAPAFDFGAVRQVQALLGAGDAHVHQPAFFLKPAFLDAGFVRQVAVLAADNEDRAELQALGRVQAHQAHGVAGLAAVGVRQQGQLRGQLTRAAAAGAFEPRGQFVQVGLAAQEAGLVLALAAHHAQQAAAFGQHRHQFGRGQALGIVAQ